MQLKKLMIEVMVFFVLGCFLCACGKTKDQTRKTTKDANKEIMIAISKEDAKLKKKQYKAKLAERRYPSVAYEIAAALEEKTNREIRVTVPGPQALCSYRHGQPWPVLIFLY